MSDAREIVDQFFDGLPPGDDVPHREWQAVKIDLWQLPAERDAWMHFAQHLAWCRWCAEDGIETCAEGNQLRLAAIAFRSSERAPSGDTESSE